MAKRCRKCREKKPRPSVPRDKKPRGSVRKAARDEQRRQKKLAAEAAKHLLVDPGSIDAVS